MSLGELRRPATGGEWWNELPESWDITQLRRVATISASNVDKTSSEDEIPVRLCNYTDVYYNDYIGPYLDFMEATATLREKDRFQLKGGEVLLTKDSETAADIAIPAYIQPGLRNVLCGYHLYMVRPEPEKLDGRFLMRAASVPPIRSQYVMAANGITRYGLGQQSLSGSWLPLPPLKQQRAIADFLDRETAKIDDLIEQKQRLIELLQEKRTALITRAVTKGLDPDVEMKDSGVEWLGEIPAHWGTAPLKHCARFVNGYSFHSSQWRNKGIPIIRIENLNRSENFNYTDSTVPSQHHVHEGNLLFSWSGNRGTSFGPFIWQRPGLHYLNQHIFKVTDFSCDKGWLYWTLKGLVHYVEKQAHGIIGMVHITSSELGSIRIPRIPRDEQERIRSHLACEVDRIDRLTQLVHQGTARLREYRTALISAAVTGKIDVRDTGSAA